MTTQFRLQFYIDQSNFDYLDIRKYLYICYIFEKHARIMQNIILGRIQLLNRKHIDRNVV